MHPLLGRVSPPPPGPTAVAAEAAGARAASTVTMLQCVDYLALDRRLEERLRGWRRAEGRALPERLRDAEAQPRRAKAALARLAASWAGSLVLGGAWGACASGREALLGIALAHAGTRVPVEGRLAWLEQQAWRLQLAPLACLQALVGAGCALGALAVCLPAAGLGAGVASLSVRLGLYGVDDADAVAWLHRVQQAFALEQRFGPWAGLDTWLASAEPPPPARARGDDTAYA